MKERKKWPWAIVGVVALIVIIVIVGSGGKTNSASQPGGGGVADSTTSTIDPTVAASTAYVAAYNTMNTGENAQVAIQNGTDPTATGAAINQRITLRQTFDQAVKAITFPSNATSDASKVLTADASLESSLGTLSANTSDTANYNQIFVTVTQDEATFAAADTALANDLGLTTTTPST
jgi:hypothetical protein